MRGLDSSTAALTMCDCRCSLRLPPKRAALREPGQATSGLAQHLIAIPTQDDGLRVAVDRGDLQAAGALYIHEEAVRGLDHALQLVPLLLLLGIRVEEVDVHYGSRAHTYASVCFLTVQKNGLS